MFGRRTNVCVHEDRENKRGDLNRVTRDVTTKFLSQNEISTLKLDKSRNALIKDVESSRGKYGGIRLRDKIYCAEYYSIISWRILF